jgi:hypothetical protein
MSDTPQRPGRRRYLPRLLLLIPLAAVLWVPSYNRIEPQLGGVPFFYWYQLAWILLGALCVWIVYALEMRIGRRAYRARGRVRL